jgi:D-aminopeptidase
VGVGVTQAGQAQDRVAPRELGVSLGVLPAGDLNAITDVAGVRVGHVTIVDSTVVNTGVTAVLPHGGNPMQEKVPAAIVVGNGFGKLMGLSQVQELGELETPIVLTGTLSVPRAADAVLTYVLGLPGNDSVRSINPVVGETNDGMLSDIRRRPVTEAHVLDAIRGAVTGPVAQGSVGAGRGTLAFGWKGGIGTSSRQLPTTLGGWTVGVLVQTNFGGVLTVAGAPVGRTLGRYHLREDLEGPVDQASVDAGDGSIMIVVATDAPADARNLERLATRALAGLARTGSAMTNGSGDYVIAFSTIPVQQLRTMTPVANDDMSPLFQAVIEATEEAIYNSLFLATTVRGHRGVGEALPLDDTVAVLRAHGLLP